MYIYTIFIGYYNTTIIYTTLIIGVGIRHLYPITDHPVYSLYIKKLK